MHCAIEKPKQTNMTQLGENGFGNMSTRFTLGKKFRVRVGSNFATSKLLVLLSFEGLWVCVCPLLNYFTSCCWISCSYIRIRPLSQQ